MWIVFMSLSYQFFSSFLNIIALFKRPNGVSQIPSIDLNYFGFDGTDINKHKTRHKFHRIVTYTTVKEFANLKQTTKQITFKLATCI